MIIAKINPFLRKFIHFFLLFFLFSAYVRYSHAQECGHDNLYQQIKCQSWKNASQVSSLSGFASFFEIHEEAYLQLEPGDVLKVWVRQPLLNLRKIKKDQMIRLECLPKIKHLTKNGFMCKLMWNDQKDLPIYVSQDGVIDPRMMIFL